jgi:hypothetical protein
MEGYKDVHTVGWFTDITQSQLGYTLYQSMKKYDAVILRPDIYYLDWGKTLLSNIPNVKKIAYIRAPVHVKTKDVGMKTPYEWNTLQLANSCDAIVKSYDSIPQMNVQGYDSYIYPGKIDTDSHAWYTKKFVWDTGVWWCVLADGAVTNQLYMAKPYLADLDGDGVADVNVIGWSAFAEKQRSGLKKWASKMKELGIPFIANGAWEPDYLKLTPDRKYTRIPPEMRTSWMMSYADGLLCEQFGKFLYYDYSGVVPTSGPVSSQLWDMYARNILEWKRKDKFVMVGGNYNGVSGGALFVTVSGFVLGVAVVQSNIKVGNPTSDMVTYDTKMSVNQYVGNYADRVWMRKYSRGEFAVNPKTVTCSAKSW